MPQSWQIWIIDRVMSGIVAGVRILIVLALAAVTIRFFRLGIERLLRRIKPRPDITPEIQEKRLATLQQVLDITVKIFVYLIAGLMILRELGLNITPILAGAGIAGVAIGFGAQTLVRDILTGLFILFEDQFNVGEVIRVNGHTGKVERLTLRTVWLRDLEGIIHIIPLGSITSVENLTRDWRNAVLNIGVAYGADLVRAIDVIRDELMNLKDDAEWQSFIMEDPVIQGVESLADSSVVIRAVLKVKPADKVHDVRREALRRLKLRLDREGIEIPFPQRTVWIRSEPAPDESKKTKSKSK